MYIIYIDADTNKIKENGLSTEQFWRTVKTNFVNNDFEQLENGSQWFVNWKENKTLGHCWALQSAFANDLPEWVRSMTEYTLYEAGRFSDPIIEKEDVERIAYLKSLDQFADDDISIERNANYLENMIHELNLIKEKGKRKSKPVDFERY